MRRISFLITLFVIHSCSVESEVIFHKDNTSTTMIDIDMKDAIVVLKSKIADTSQTKETGIEDLGKIPKGWTSTYKLGKNIRKLKIEDPDSIQVMKKIFMKSNFDKDEMLGLSLKMDHFSKDDYQKAGKLSKNYQIPIDQAAMNSWDGKTLTIDTRELTLNGIKNILINKDVSPIQAQTSIEYVKMMYKKIGTTLRFEKKIKSITGKHDWITKTDDYSLKINYDLNYLFSPEKDRKPLINADEKVIVVTE
ncbi:hypothetical protein QFZ37_000822 [Chryseobacterium ginsenosidimutans]|uniref:hypothetical protein n=1 Tax=Chryseobacterium ginsenosidimutans TaxID=687846 RepID=UPI00277D4E1C|nr:hypothetical protein [Chryseobacterium ginsenosidimutans]MDQ0592453.1 hypothetical protein [Chryseobacterium ginsenosidimutans]